MSNTCTTHSPGARMRELTSRTCAAPLHMEGARSLRQAMSLIDEIARDAAPSERERYRVGVGARSIILSLMRTKARYAVRAARLSMP